MIDKAILILCIFYLNIYGARGGFNLLIELNRFYTNLFNSYNKILYPDFWDEEDAVNHKETFQIKKDFNKDKNYKYEDKYLKCIRQLNREWVFSQYENDELNTLAKNKYNEYIEYKENRIEEIIKIIINLENEISKNIDSFTCIGDDDHSENNEKRNLIKELQEESASIKQELNNKENQKNVFLEESRGHMIDKRLNKLKNCYAMEKTPIGNVIMLYDKDNELFKYYSDSNMPYRYLEVVGRKYVKMFDCRPIFVDMEEELKLFEERWNKEQEIKKNKRHDNDQDIGKNNTKKSVFAKFKNYNKDVGKIGVSIPPKNNIPKSFNSENKENEKIIIKEKANRYTYEGKFANFNFLQKIEKKVFNKRLGVSFADFKKMNKNIRIN